MEIEFSGVVSKGCGEFAKRSPLPDAVPELANLEGWPSTLEQGTFNIKLDKSELSNSQHFYFKEEGVKCLDLSPIFPPAAYLPYSVIPGNTITPQTKGEHAGDLQFWKAILKVPQKEIVHNCYMLRRVRSGCSLIIELVSNVHIRSHYKLKNGDKVSLTVFGEDPDKQL